MEQQMNAVPSLTQSQVCGITMQQYQQWQAEVKQREQKYLHHIEQLQKQIVLLSKKLASQGGVSTRTRS